MSELTTIQDGVKPREVSDAEAAEMLSLIGVKSITPIKLRVAKELGEHFNRLGVAEVALTQTFENNDFLEEALRSAAAVLDNPDDMVKVRGVSSIATLIKARISNSDLALKCAEALGANRRDTKKPSCMPPIFPGSTVHIHQAPTPEKPVAEA